MDDELVKKFLEEAASIRLTAEEKQVMRAGIQAFVVGKEMDQLEAEATAFFASAEQVGMQEWELLDNRLVLQEFMQDYPVRAGWFSRLNKQMDNKFKNVSRPEDHSLTGVEKQSMRKRLQRYMAHNLPQADVPPLSDEGGGVNSWFTLLVQGVLPRTLLLGCAFLIIGSGAAYAAEDTVPGDFLYPLKVDIVEQIRSRLTFTEQEKAKWEGTRALRRLEEVEQLAATDALTQDTLVHLQGRFEEHVVEAERHIDSVAGKGDVQAAQQLSGDLEVFLQAHHSVMDAINQERTDSSDIRDAIKKVREGILKKTTEKYVPTQTAEEPGRTKLDAESRIKQALNAVETGRSNSSDADTGSVADETLEKADVLIERAHTQFSAGSFKEASSLAREAVRFAEEAKILKKLPVQLPRRESEEGIVPESSSHSLSSSSQSSVSSVSLPLPDIQIHLDLESDVKVPGL